MELIKSPAESDVLVESTTEKVFVPLEKEELGQKKEDFYKSSMQLFELEERIKEVMKAFADEKKGRKREIKQIAAEIEMRGEFKPFSFEIRADRANAEIYKLCVETGEIVEKRRMTPSERAEHSVLF